MKAGLLTFEQPASLLVTTTAMAVVEQWQSEGQALSRLQRRGRPGLAPGFPFHPTKSTSPDTHILVQNVPGLWKRVNESLAGRVAE